MNLKNPTECFPFQLWRNTAGILAPIVLLFSAGICCLPAGESWIHVRSPSEDHSRVEIRLLLPDAGTETLQFRRLELTWGLRIKPSVICARTARFRDMIASCLDDYPSYLYTSVLDNIYLVRKLQFPTGAAAGTYTQRSILIAMDDTTTVGARSVFHHELSSLLLLRFGNKFSAEQFRAQNPKGFEYGHFTNDGLRWNPSLREEYAMEGFVGGYGQNDMENDFNLFAEELFTPSPGFWNYIQKYPAFRKKAECVAAFYAALDPQYSWAFFKRRGISAGLDNNSAAKVQQR